MEKKFNILLFIFIILFVNSCFNESYEKNPYAELMQKDPSTQIKNYEMKSEKWEDRIYNIDTIRMNYVKNLNKIDGFSEIPIPTDSLEEKKKSLSLIAKSFHPKIQSLFNKYVLAVYFCEKLGGTGLSGFVYDEKGNPVGGFIIIDATIINKKANDWITYKEESVYLKNKINLSITIEYEMQNTIENSIRYILLHEMGHILSNSFKITPDYREKKWRFEHPFFRNVWIPSSKTTSTYDKEVFPIRPKIIFYAEKNKLIDLDANWEKIYPKLENTNFPTLYGATNVHDHFAETFVSYVHCIVDGRPWTLTLSDKDSNIFTMKNRIHEMDLEKKFLKDIIFEKN